MQKKAPQQHKGQKITNTRENVTLITFSYCMDLKAEILMQFCIGAMN